MNDRPRVTARFAVGVEVESRPAASRWIDRVVRVVRLAPGQRAVPDWAVLADADDVVRYYAGTASLLIRSSETKVLKDNLEAPEPALYVVLRRGGEGPLGWRLHLVTADPSEAHAHADVGEDLVEALPMPAPIRAWLTLFVAQHHVEPVEYKRKRDKAGAEPRGGEGGLGRWSRLKQEGRRAAAREEAPLAPPALGAERLAALRASWAGNPAITGHRPLVDYDYDFHAPGYGRLKPVDDIAKLVAALHRPRAAGADAPGAPEPDAAPQAMAEAPEAETAPQALEEAPEPEPDPQAAPGTEPQATAEATTPEPLAGRRHGGAAPV